VEHFGWPPGLDAEHLALRLPPLQEDIPPLPDAIAAFKDALARCREAEERLAQVMTEGGWLQ
jgi:type I restriction enzyme M protein